MQKNSFAYFKIKVRAKALSNQNMTFVFTAPFYICSVYNQT